MSDTGHFAEKHRESRALVVIISTDAQFAADSINKSANNLHPQSFAGGSIKVLRQRKAVIGDRERVPSFWVRLQKSPC